jgi:hypothetical protein
VTHYGHVVSLCVPRGRKKYDKVGQPSIYIYAHKMRIKYILSV